MDYYINIILHLLYRLILILPVLIVFIALIKLLKKYNNLSIKLMLIGQVGFLVKSVILDNVYVYFTQIKPSLDIQQLASIAIFFIIYSIVFSLFFAIGFFMFVKEELLNTQPKN